MRIVSICPSNTEIACVLGLGDQLVGLDRSSDFPPAVNHLPRVGPDLNVDIHAILALKADLVLSSLSVPGMEQNLAALDAAGLAHLAMDAESIAGVYASIRTLGRLVGRGAKAETVVLDMQARLDAVQRARMDGMAPAAANPVPKVYLEWWPKPPIVPGRRCWTTEMIEIAGGQALFRDLDVRSTPVEAEEIIARAPDILLTCWCGVPHERQTPHKVRERPGWETIPGVRGGYVYAAEECLFGRPGPRLVDGVEWLQARIEDWGRGRARVPG